MGKYNIPKLSRLIFPWFWQNDINNEFIDLLMSSLDAVNDNTSLLELDIAQKVGYSIQRLSLETSLNNKFDNSERRITIQNGESVGTDFIFNENETPSESLIIYIYNEAETTPEGEEDAYFYNETETSGGANVGFTVFIPSELTGLQQEIEGWIDRVLISGTSYQIIVQ